MKIQDTLEVLQRNAQESEDWLEKTKKDTTVPIADLIKDYWRLKGLHDDLKKAVTRIYHVVNALEKGEIPSRMALADIDMVRIPDLERSFNIRTMTSASLVDKEKGMRWLRDEGHGDLIQETVNAGTLAAFCRNLMLEEGVEPPDDIIKVSSYNTIGSAKYKPKKT